MNNLEQVFQSVAALPAELNFDGGEHSANGNSGGANDRASVSSNASSDGHNSHNGNGGVNHETFEHCSLGQSNSNGSNSGGGSADDAAATATEQNLSAAVGAALDYVDVVIYSVLETLQGKVGLSSFKVLRLILLCVFVYRFPLCSILFGNMVIQWFLLLFIKIFSFIS